MSTKSIVRPPPRGARRQDVGSAHDRFRLSGSTIVIAGFVFSQFVDITVGNTGGMVVSVQKIEAAFLLSLGFLLLGRIRARIEWLLVATFFSIAFSFALLLDGRLADSASALFALFLSIISAIVLANAISVRNDRLRLLAQMWIWACLITSLIAVGQAFGKVPTLRAPEMLPYAGAQARGSGLKTDPNFCAILLVLGLVFSRFYISRVWRKYVWLILFVGLLATSSRMGAIVGAVFVVWSAGLPDTPPTRHPPATQEARISLRLRRLLLLVAAGLVALSFAPAKMQTYTQVRGADLIAAYSGVFYGTSATNPDGINQTSGSARAELVRLTLAIFQQHWVAGVGANQVPVYIGEQYRAANAAHNTYLETAAVGGIMGIAALIMYFVAFRRLAKLSAINRADPINLNCTKYIFASMVAMGLVLTFDYNSILWLPLALSAGIAQGATDRTSPSP